MSRVSSVTWSATIRGEGHRLAAFMGTLSSRKANCRRTICQYSSRSGGAAARSDESCESDAAMAGANDARPACRRKLRRVVMSAIEAPLGNGRSAGQLEGLGLRAAGALGLWAVRALRAIFR